MPTSDELIEEVGANIQEKATLIWNVADTLRGPFKPHEYGPLIFVNSTFPKFFGNALMAAFAENTEAFQSLFTDEAKYAAVRDALAQLLWGMLGEGKQGE